MTTPLPLKPMHLPESPSWFPLAWGWWGLLLVIVLLICGVSYFFYQRRQILKGKNCALMIFKQQRKTLTAAMALELVRQAALSYFPRSDVAGLSGEGWLNFLDQQLRQPRFLTKTAVWEQALYQQQGCNESEVLIEDCYYWLLNALPPKKKRAARDV